MKKYEKPEIEVVNFSVEPVANTSVGGNEGGTTSDKLSGEGGWN